MTRETIEPRSGGRGGSGVTCAWRKVSDRTGKVLVVTLSTKVCERIGLSRGLRLRAERDRMKGMLFLTVDPVAGWKPAWKATTTSLCACAHIPLDDVQTDRRAAQDVVWAFGQDGMSVEIKLPHWACPLVQVTGGRAA